MFHVVWKEKKTFLLNEQAFTARCWYWFSDDLHPPFPSSLPGIRTNPDEKYIEKRFVWKNKFIFVSSWFAAYLHVKDVFQYSAS